MKVSKGSCERTWSIVASLIGALHYLSFAAYFRIKYLYPVSLDRFCDVGADVGAERMGAAHPAVLQGRRVAAGAGA